jgi:hypothetical protein
MNDPVNPDAPKAPEHTSSETGQRAANPAPDAASEAAPKKKPKEAAEPKIKVGDIYKLLEKSFVIDERAVDRVFETLSTVDDPAPLLASLLKDSMNGVKRPIWNSLRKLDVPGRIFNKLCQSVGAPGLGSKWDLMGRKASPEIMALLREYVPPSKESAATFLRDRSMLPLSLLIYRSFRNENETLGKVFRTWVSEIASGCLDQKKDPIQEAQRAAKWLAEISARKSNPAQFLSDIAPAMVALRLGSTALEKADKLAEENADLQSDLEGERQEGETLRNRILQLEALISRQQSEIADAGVMIRKLEDKIAFGSAHQGESESQAVGAMRQKLKAAILTRTEDAKVLLERSDPNIGEALDLLTEIERQFQ